MLKVINKNTQSLQLTLTKRIPRVIHKEPSDMIPNMSERGVNHNGLPRRFLTTQIDSYKVNKKKTDMSPYTVHNNKVETWCSNNFMVTS